MPTKMDNRIKLRDGRALGYAEVGDPLGQPVLHFHGTPSSRFEGSRPAVDEIATRIGARVILPERPGFGLSDFKPKRAILDWPDDVIELADALNLDRFAVMGLSGGGPYVAACAWKISARLSAAGILSGLGPLDAPGAFDGMAKSDRQLFAIAQRFPWLLRPLAWYLTRGMRENPDKIIEQFLADLPGPDKVAMNRPDVKEMLIKMAIGGLEQGVRGTAWEYALFTRQWGFRLEDISMSVHVWHGEIDAACPISMGRYVASSIPSSRAKFYPKEGHLSLFVNHYEAVLSAMVD